MHNPSYSLGTLIQRYFNERLVSQLNASQHTISSYRDAWRMFLSYQTGGKRRSITLDEFTAENLLGFLSYLETTRGCCIRSRNQRLAVFKAFAHFAIYADPSVAGQMQRILSIPSKRYEKYVLNYLEKEEMEALLSVPNRETASGRRNYALMLTLYNTGARVSEVASICAPDLTVRKGASQLLIHGKGSKQRIVPIWDETADVLIALIRQECSEREPELFKNARGEPITRGGIAHILKKTVTKASQTCAGLAGRKISPHTLRHTTAMHLLQSGVDMHLIRMWLGHVKLDTTHQYIEADLNMKRAALQKGGIIPPSNNPKWKPTDEILAFLEGIGK